MARLLRLAIAGQLHHVLQRAGHGQLLCRDTQDFETLRAALGASARQHGVALHGYVLLADHFHLLLSPSTVDALPLMMQALGRAYVRYFNHKYDRRGTLWEGRFKSTVLQPTYFLPVLIFMDQHAQRTQAALAAQDYPWSSYAHYSGARPDKHITPHSGYWDLGNTPFAREAAYQAAAQGGLTGQQYDAITDSVTRGWALGDADFVDALQKTTPRRLTRKSPGRPASVPR